MVEAEVRDCFGCRGDTTAGSCLKEGQDICDMWPDCQAQQKVCRLTTTDRGLWRLPLLMATGGDPELASRVFFDIDSTLFQKS